MTSITASALTFDEPIPLIAAFLIGTIATARLTRLIVDDSFPPVRAVTDWYIHHTNEKWGLLAECPWCVSFWIALANTGAAWASDLAWWWWFANVPFAVSWIAAYMCLRDIPPDQR